MSSKEKAHSRDKSTAKQRPTQHDGQASETVDWLNHPATIVRRAALAPGSLTPADVLRLQRTVGNRAVSRLIYEGGPGSGAVRAGPLAQQRPGAGSQRTVQRQEEDEEPLQMQPLPRQELDEEEALQAKTDIHRVGVEGGPVPPEVESAINSARGGGQPLERAVQEQMSETMGHDFSGVRVHADAEADHLNQQLQAKAFTTGPDIFFKRGAYEPGSSGGRELIAHELSHVVQQNTGRVTGAGSGMTIRPAGDAYEQEADARAQAAAQMSGTRGQRSEQRTPDRRRYSRGGAARLNQGVKQPGSVQQSTGNQVQRAYANDAMSVLSGEDPKVFTTAAKLRKMVDLVNTEILDPHGIPSVRPTTGEPGSVVARMNKSAWSIDYRTYGLDEKLNNQAGRAEVVEIFAHEAKHAEQLFWRAVEKIRRGEDRNEVIASDEHSIAKSEDLSKDQKISAAVENRQQQHAVTAPRGDVWGRVEESATAARGRIENPGLLPRWWRRWRAKAAIEAYQRFPPENEAFKEGATQGLRALGIEHPTDEQKAEWLKIRVVAFLSHGSSLVDAVDDPAVADLTITQRLLNAKKEK